MGERSVITKVSVTIINSVLVVSGFQLIFNFLSRYISYVKAAANTRLVGKQLAFLLKGLEKNNGLNYTRVHIIGFSLGKF